MKILKVDDKYINMDHILCYDVHQTDRGPERIITFTAYLNSNIQIREAFFTKTCKFSSHDVKEKVVELFCQRLCASHLLSQVVCVSLDDSGKVLLDLRNVLECHRLRPLEVSHHDIENGYCQRQKSHHHNQNNLQ